MSRVQLCRLLKQTSPIIRDEKAARRRSQSFSHTASNLGRRITGIAKDLECLDHTDDGAEQAQQWRQGHDSVEQPQPAIQLGDLPKNRFLQELRQPMRMLQLGMLERHFQQGSVRQSWRFLDEAASVFRSRWANCATALVTCFPRRMARPGYQKRSIITVNAINSMMAII